MLKSLARNAVLGVFLVPGATLPLYDASTHLKASASQPACAIESPKSGSDIRGVVLFRVACGHQAPVQGCEFSFESQGAQSGPFHSPVDTRSLGADGPVQVIARCGVSRVTVESPPSRLWLSNRLGSVLGVNSSLSKQDVDLVSQLGLRWIRADAEWGFHRTEEAFRADVERSAHGEGWPSLKPLRERLSYAHQLGLRVLVIAMGSPDWAHGAASLGGYVWHQAILPRRRAAFAEYVKELCLEGVDAVEVINEPNGSAEYIFGPDHPRAAFPDERVDDYVQLLRAVYQHVKADPRTRTCLIGIGAPSSYGHELVATGNAIHPRIWYHRLFHATADDRKTATTAAGSFDFASVHPYGEENVDKGPTEWDHRWTRFALQYGDAAYAHGMAMVHRIRSELVAAGQGGKPLWATEVGAATFGGQCQAKPCKSEARQREWLQQYIRAWFSNEPTGWHSPLAERFYGDFTGPLFYYQLRDKSNGIVPPLNKEGFFGLLKYNGTEKLAFAELARIAATTIQSLQ